MKTAELTGAALDWAVAKAEDLPLELDPMGFKRDAPKSRLAGWWVQAPGFSMILGYKKTSFTQHEGYSPSTDWAQGGPIIEREEIYARPTGDAAKWEAMVWRDTDSIATCGFRHTMYGSTPLIAAMRCFVHSKLGDEIDVPKELLP